MSTSEYYNCIAKIYTDDIVRSYFFSNPDIIFRFFILTPSEQKELASLNESAVQKLSSTLKHKCQNGVEKVFGLLFEHFADVYSTLFSRAYEIIKHSPGEEKNFYWIRVGEYFLSSIRYTTLPQYCYDLTKYYVLKLKLSLYNFDEYQIHSKKITMDAFPVMYPTIRIESFDYDINSLMKSVHRHFIPTICSSYYLMQYKTNKFRLIEIDERLYSFLSMCNGAYKVKDILQKLYNQHPDNMTKKVYKNLKMLQLNKWVYFK
jgi:hypothetical protein